MRLRSLAASFLVAVLLASCSSDPTPLSRRSPSAPSLEDSDRAALDPTVSPPHEAPPSADELATTGEPTDVAVPDMFKSDDASDAEKKMGFSGVAGIAGGPPMTFFLNSAGGTYAPGPDDAGQHLSSVLSYYQRGAIWLPPSGYTGASWQELVNCVKAQYAGLNVVITDQRPAGGAYSELVVTNTWAANALGISNAIGGIAPIGACRAVPQAVGYVFQPIYDQPGYGGVRGACEAVAHEMGHSLSLSHERLSTDLMSYAPASLQKAFQDTPSACGVSSQAPEYCSCGGSTQSSRQQLLAVVGAGTPGGGGGGGGGGGAPPMVSIVSPATGTSLPGNGVIRVVVDASDDKPLSDVKLVWQYTGASLPCDSSIQDVSCTQTGSRYTWSINVGSGPRSFYAYARDTDGNSASTPVVSITATSSTPPTTESPPVVTAQLPVDRVAIARGGELIFQAAVSADRPIADVRAVWSYAGGSLEYPMVQTTTPGVYQARTTVSTTAAAGWRSVDIQASTDKGLRTSAPRTYVYVQ